MRIVCIYYLAICILTSCTIEIKDPLIGIWKISDIETIDSLKVSIDKLGQVLNISQLKEGVIFELKENDTYSLINKKGNEIEKGKWLVSNDRAIITLTAYVLSSDSTIIPDKNRIFEIASEYGNVLKLRKPGKGSVYILTKQ